MSKSGTGVPSEAEVEALRAASGELRKPVSVVKALERLREARRIRHECAERTRQHIIELMGQASRLEPDAYLQELDRQLKAAEAGVGEARRDLAEARRKWGPKAHADINALAEPVRDVIGRLLSAVEAAAAPVVAAADESVLQHLGEPRLAVAVRQVWLHARAARKALEATVVPQVKVRFVQRVAGDGYAYEPGQIIELSEPSARRWLHRGLAMPADQPWEPPTPVRVRMLRTLVVERETYQEGREYDLAEGAARRWVEDRDAVPVDQTLWHSMFRTARQAVASAIDTIEVRRGLPRSTPI